jgi:ABC-type Fe3+/spermidine/putrescine transport system ATPase subunit
VADVRLVDVVKRFGRAVAVDHVSLEVPEGHFITLLGPSGCGKTTTLRMVAGFHPADAGDILIGGVRVNDIPPHRRPTSMVFQEYALFPHMSVFDNVAYGLRRRRTPSPELHRRVDTSLTLVGLAGVEQKYPAQLSGGQQQRVALARALVVEPEVLLLDEPLSNLDAKLRVRVRKEIRRLQQQLGKTTIYVTHDQEEALAISDRIAVMDQGRILQVGTPVEIYRRPAHRFVADFVGLANFVQAEVLGPGRVRTCGVVLRIDGPAPSGSRVLLMLRPEAIQLRAHTGEQRENVIRGQITGMSFLGTLARYWVDAGGMEWTVDIPSPGETALSGDVDLYLPTERIHILQE